MNDVISGAFRDELQKVGVALPPAGVAVPVALGTALSGLALYDFIKGRQLDPKLTREFITGEGEEQVTSRKAIKELLEKRPLIRPVVPVTTDKDVDKMLKDPRFGFLVRSGLRSEAKEMIDEAANAAVIQGAEKDYVIIPSKAHPRIVEHEVGHLQDFARKIDDPGVLRRLLSLIWKPEHDKQIMDRERRAWAYAEKTPRREQGLKSYERGFHNTRAGIVFPAALMAFSAALRHLPAAGGV